MSDYTSMSEFGMGFDWLVPTLFITLLVYFIIALLKSDSSASDILDKKYASGELDEKEYKIKKEALRSL